MFLQAFLLWAFLGQQEPSVLVTTHPGAGEVSLWGQGEPDGKYFDYVVSDSLFAKVPEWTPDKEGPPLSIAKALEIAKRATRSEHAQFTDLMCWYIQMQQASSGNRRNRWFYIFELIPVENGEPSIFTHITVLVLMDGTVVKPREKKPQQK
jgi:hypothetical protein